MKIIWKNIFKKFKSYGIRIKPIFEIKFYRDSLGKCMQVGETLKIYDRRPSIIIGVSYTLKL